MNGTRPNRTLSVVHYKRCPVGTDLSLRGMWTAMDCGENSAINILQEVFLARSGPHAGYPVWRTDVFAALEDVVYTGEHV